MSSENITTSIRIRGDIKKGASDVFDNMGLSMSQAINMFLVQVVHQRRIPFEIKLPNDDTLHAFEEDRGKLKVYDTPKDSFEDLGI